MVASKLPGVWLPKVLEVVLQHIVYKSICLSLKHFYKYFEVPQAYVNAWLTLILLANLSWHYLFSEVTIQNIYDEILHT